MELIDRLIEKYKEYNSSDKFINICFNALNEAGFTTKEITSFIFNHFSNREIKHRSCSEHKIKFLLNLHIKNSQLQYENSFYKSYKLSSINYIKYKIILNEYRNLRQI